MRYRTIKVSLAVLESDTPGASYGTALAETTFTAPLERNSLDAVASRVRDALTGLSLVVGMTHDELPRMLMSPKPTSMEATDITPDRPRVVKPDPWDEPDPLDAMPAPVTDDGGLTPGERRVVDDFDTLIVGLVHPDMLTQEQGDRFVEMTTPAEATEPEPIEDRIETGDNGMEI